MIRAIIFDCFGVLCEGSLDYFVSRAVPENRQAVVDANRSADYGYTTHEEYVGELASLLQITPDDVEDIMRRRHMRNEPMFDLARSLKPPYKLGLLSNVGGNTLDKLFTEDELTHFFDAAVLSGEVGMVKPYAAIYEYIANELGVLPEECVMIDDSPRNVEGAMNVGMRGIVCSSARQVKTELDKLFEEHNA